MRKKLSKIPEKWHKMPEKWPNMPEKWPNLIYVPNFGTKSGHILKDPEFQDNVLNSGHSGLTGGFLSTPLKKQMGLQEFELN